MTDNEHTISYVEQRDDADQSFVAPYLVLSMQCATPMAAPARFSVAEVEEVRIGRGASRSHKRLSDDGRSVLRIDVPDSWMSSSHARMMRQGNRWLIEDAGSKNGTFVDGDPVQLRPLTDGALIEAGNTIFVFRDAVRRQFREPADVDAEQFDGQNPALATLNIDHWRTMQTVMRIASADVAVVITGETGTGKELTARLLHELSGRTGRFMAINCGALPGNLIESELFGYKKGAFSGANEDRPGLLRAADQGTLLLDEIAELPEPAQVKLLRALQEREVLAVGATRPVPIDIRVIAATHEDLPALVEAGTFREDLFGRLAGFRLVLPALRDRREDIGLLVALLLPRVCRTPQAVSFHRSAARLLFRYDWPRNIRQLEQALGAAVTMAAGEPVGIEHLPADLRALAEPAGSADPRDEELRLQLVRLLEVHQGNISAVARELGKARVQIRRWCKRLGLDPEAYRV